MRCALHRRSAPALLLVLVGCSSDPGGATGPSAEPLDAGVGGAAGASSGDASADAPPDTGSLDADADADADAPSCAAGTVADRKGVCMPVGIQACAPMFLGADGLCHPTAAACAGGTIPHLTTGCAAVGVPVCAAPFLGADGACAVAASACPAGTFALPQEGCVSIDGPEGCGTGTWGNVPDMPGSLYVDGAAPAGGDGTLAKPLSTIAAALAKVSAGGRVVLAAGAYAEPIVPGVATEIRGRCASMVKITGASDSPVGKTTVYVGGVDHVSLRGLELDGAPQAAVIASSAGSSLSWVHARGAADGGVYVPGAKSTVTLDHCWVESQSTTAALARGIDVEHGASVTIGATRIDGARDAAVFVDGPGTTVTLSGSLIDGQLPAADGTPSSGFLVQKSAALAVAGSVILAAKGSASLVDGGSLSVSASALEPLALSGGATAKITTSVLAGAAYDAITVGDAGTTLALSGSLITGTKADAAPTDGSGAIALDVAGGAVVTVDGCAFTANEQIALFANGSGTDVTLTRTLIEGTLAPETGGATGALVGDGAHLVVDSCAFVGNGAHGLLANGGNAEISATLVEGTTAQSDGTAGYGVAVVTGGNVTLASSVLTGNHTAAVTLSQGNLTATGSLIEGTLAQVADGQLGTAFVVFGSTLSLSSSVLRNNATAAVIVHGAPSTATIDDTWIAGVLAGSSSVDGGGVQMLGDGIDVLYGSTAIITATRIEGCARSGIVYYASGGSVSGTTSTANQFGIVLESSPSPALGDGNVFTDNTSMNTVMDGALPVPSNMLAVP